jgi:hypothetical protein
MTLTVELDGKNFTTIEGLEDAQEGLELIQQAFIDEYAFQGGYCTDCTPAISHKLTMRDFTGCRSGSTAMEAYPIQPKTANAGLTEACGWQAYEATYDCRKPPALRHRPRKVTPDKIHRKIRLLSLLPSKHGIPPHLPFACTHRGAWRSGVSCYWSAAKEAGMFIV